MVVDVDVVIVVGIVVEDCGPRPQKKMLPWSPTLKIMKTMKTKTWRRNKRNQCIINCLFSYKFHEFEDEMLVKNIFRFERHPDVLSRVGWRFLVPVLCSTDSPGKLIRNNSLNIVISELYISL